MAFDEFQYVVIGNEPAGLWLLSALEKAHREKSESVHMGWVSLGADPTPVCLPSLMGLSFGVGPAAPWSAEIATPRHCFSWTQKNLTERFAELPPLDLSQDPLQSLAKPLRAERLSIQSAIRQNPELIAYAQGLWKMLGRTSTLAPETLVHYARYFCGLQWWSPDREIPTSVERIMLSLSDNGIEGFEQSRGGNFSLTFKNFGQVVSRRWILNMDVRTLNALAYQCPALLQLLGVNADMALASGLYPLPILVEHDAIPSPVPPLTVYYDTEVVPDPGSEIWPLSLRTAGELRELTLWATAPALVSLEAVLERFRAGMKRVYGVFPFLHQKLVQLPVPLGMETCFEAEQRRAVLDTLQGSSYELYNHTGFRTDTRAAAVSVLFPFIGCHLPYPLGTLSAARQYVLEHVPAPKKEKGARNTTSGFRNAGNPSALK